MPNLDKYIHLLRDRTMIQVKGWAGILARLPAAIRPLEHVPEKHALGL
jgi:hypothetical protein